MQKPKNVRSRRPDAEARMGISELPEDFQQRLRGFQESRALLTAIELDIFTAVGKGASAVQVAKMIGTNPRATEMLLHALVALGMLTKQDGLFLNTPLTAQFFCLGSPDNARLAMMHLVHLWETWSTLTECVKKGTRVDQDETQPGDQEWTEAFIGMMDRLASARAPRVVQAVGAQGVRRMLDVGGGSGAYSIAFARANAQLHSELFDLPTVTPIAQKHIKRAGLTGRVKTREGDLRTGPLGKGFDLVFVSAICHMLGPDENLDLLRRCYAALAPGGRIIISDFLLDADKCGPKHAALFALNMLVGTRAGSTYSEQEYTEWLRAAGFQSVKRIALPGPAHLMVGMREGRKERAR